MTDKIFCECECHIDGIQREYKVYSPEDTAKWLKRKWVKSLAESTAKGIIDEMTIKIRTKMTPRLEAIKQIKELMFEYEIDVSEL